MLLKSITEVSQETGISKITLIKRANILKIPKKVGTQFVVSKEDEKRLLDPSLHRGGKSIQKKNYLRWIGRKILIGFCKQSLKVIWHIKYSLNRF